MLTIKTNVQINPDQITLNDNGVIQLLRLKPQRFYLPQIRLDTARYEFKNKSEANHSQPNNRSFVSGFAEMFWNTMFFCLMGENNNTN